MSESRWPTPLEPDGSAPVLLRLLGSTDLVLVRQAAYLITAGKALKQSGYEIEAFQQPLGSVTIPCVMKNSKGLPAVVYTYSEPWDTDAVSALTAWVTALRAAGAPPQVPVIVVSHTDAPEVKALPTVFQFIHMPDENLPRGPAATPEATPAEGTPAEAQSMAAKFVAMMLRKGHNLDYSPETLKLVDACVDEIKATGVPEENASGMIYAVGCYVGEVFVKHAGAEWRPTTSLGMERVCSWPIALRLPSGAGANPIGKAFKRFRNGDADSLAFFYHATLNLPRA